MLWHHFKLSLGVEVDINLNVAWAREWTCIALMHGAYYIRACPVVTTCSVRETETERTHDYVLTHSCLLHEPMTVHMGIDNVNWDDDFLNLGYILKTKNNLQLLVVPKLRRK